jgi:dephospho-CoA kinase
MHMETEQISARVELSPYTNKVLAVLKAKYGLKDKSEAINKFAELHGEEIVEKEAKEEYIKEMIREVHEHFKRYGYKSMNFEELDALCEV